jgi:hypothetical protein
LRTTYPVIATFAYPVIANECEAIQSIKPFIPIFPDCFVPRFFFFACGKNDVVKIFNKIWHIATILLSLQSKLITNDKILIIC